MKYGLKIGIFDSGLGGLIIAKAVRKMLPKYDYVYFGDTKRVPYGNKSHETVFELTKNAVDYLFRKENCGIVILACNTASARALREIQQKYLTKNFPDRRVLGVLVPTAEEAAKHKGIGVLATHGTVNSKSFQIEINKLNKQTKIWQEAAPILVPLAEEGELKLALPFLKKYLRKFQDKNLEALILGCTHYPIFKKEIKKNVGSKVKIISQDEIIPKKFKDYLDRHPEIEKKLSKKSNIKIIVTDKTQNINNLSRRWFGKVKINLI
jgi:glutamate racemase